MPCRIIRRSQKLSNNIYIDHVGSCVKSQSTINVPMHKHRPTVPPTTVPPSHLPTVPQPLRKDTQYQIQTQSGLKMYHQSKTTTSPLNSERNILRGNPKVLMQARHCSQSNRVSKHWLTNRKPNNDYRHHAFIRNPCRSKSSPKKVQIFS